jgi:hypothetical protein
MEEDGGAWRAIYGAVQACDLRQYLQRDARAAVLVQRLAVAKVPRGLGGPDGVGRMAWAGWRGPDGVGRMAWAGC